MLGVLNKPQTVDCEICCNFAAYYILDPMYPEINTLFICNSCYCWGKCIDILNHKIQQVRFDKAQNKLKKSKLYANNFYKQENTD